MYIYHYFLVKLVTKELIGFEGQLLKGYKIYLTNLEKLASSLHRKKGDTRVITNVCLKISNSMRIFFKLMNKFNELILGSYKFS